MNNQHFLLLACAPQGHINPTLQLAKFLIRAGARVTFTTTVHGLSQIKTLPSIEGLTYASFSDGFDDGKKPTNDPHHMMSELKRVGTQTLTNLITTLANEQHPVTFLIYSVMLPWAADVARDLGMPSAFLCIQSAAAFAIYHHYFNSQNGMYDKDKNDPPSFIKLQGLPPFASNEIPSFLLPSSPHALIIPTFQQHIQALEQDSNPCVLLNTFDALEEEAIKAIGNMNLITIGPLIPSAYLDKNNPSDTSFGCDLFDSSRDYSQWLNSKPNRSVVYVSFGSLAVLQRKQLEEIFNGLVDTHKPFLWVIRSLENGEGVEDMIKEELNEEEGLIVPWCSQVEVLNHQSVGCFVTHCGWNSTMESLVAGVPVVGCPQFSDQTTNAKMVEEIWRNGVRAKVNEEGFVEREEIKRCVEMVMGGGERGEEIRRNVENWRDLALKAVKEGGSSYNNVRRFMETLG